MTKKKRRNDAVQVDPSKAMAVEGSRADVDYAALPLDERVVARYSVLPGRLEELKAASRTSLQTIRARELEEPVDEPLGPRLETLADDLAVTAHALELRIFNVIRAACEPLKEP